MSSVVELVRSWHVPRAFAWPPSPSASPRAVSNRPASTAVRTRRSKKPPVRSSSSARPTAACRPRRCRRRAAASPRPCRRAVCRVGAAGWRRIIRASRPIRSTGSVQAPPPQAQSPHSLPPPVRQSKAPASRIAPTQPVVHVVAPGETLIRIARKYNMPLTELARLNNIPPHTKVKIGDRITIPATRAARATPAETQKVAAQPKALSAPAKGKTETESGSVSEGAAQVGPGSRQRSAGRPNRRRRGAQPAAAHHQFRPRRQWQPVVPLAGGVASSRASVRRPPANERRHQHRASGRHADQGGRGRRRRLCRQRAQGLRRSGADAALERLRHCVRSRQRDHGQARRAGEARPGDRQGRRPAT